MLAYRALQTDSLPKVKHEAQLTGKAHSMQDRNWSGGKLFEFGEGQPLLFMRLSSPFVEFPCQVLTEVDEVLQGVLWRGCPLYALPSLARTTTNDAED